jgi:hypothetical protein
MAIAIDELRRLRLAENAGFAAALKDLRSHHARWKIFFSVRVAAVIDEKAAVIDEKAPKQQQGRAGDGSS